MRQVMASVSTILRTNSGSAYYPLIKMTHKTRTMSLSPTHQKDMVPKYFSQHSTLGWTTIRPDKYIRCIYKDNDGIIWAGGYYNLKSYNMQTKEIQCYSMDFPVTCIKNKDRHNLWIGTINGLYQFNKRNQTLKPVNLDSGIE